MHYPNVYTEYETLHLATEGKSLARFGDGELRLCRGEDSVSQVWSPEISTELRNILTERDAAYIACIPNLQVIEPAKASPRQYFWQVYKTPQFTTLYRDEIEYGSSFVTRPDNAPWIDNEAFWSKFESLWADDKRVLLVAGHPEKFAPFLDFTKMAYVPGLPKENAYDQLDKIEAQLMTTASMFDTILISLGAAGTCLAARLARRGVHAVDIGHVFMFLNPLNRGAFSYGIDDLATPAYRAELAATHAAKPWGDSGWKFYDQIVPFLEANNAKFVVDYGAGQGTLGKKLRARGYRVEEFDPSREPFTPPKICDVVLSTDVFEHVEPEKLDNVLRYTYLVARKAAWFAIAKQPAKRILAHTGRNAHLICEPTEFWVDKLKKAGWQRVKVIGDKWKKVRIVCYKGDSV